MTDSAAPPWPQQQPLWVVEAWRALAAALVVWVHWGPSLGWPMGPMAFAFSGVDLFFVLSGFVFAPTVMGGSQSAGAWGAYTLRRLARIYPAYLAALLLYAYLVHQRGLPLLHLPEHLLMAQMQSREMVFYYNPVFWSLPSEVAFYALVPLLTGLLAQPSRRAWLWPLLLLLALALRLAMVRPADGVSQNWAYISLHHIPGLLCEFFLGIWVWQLQQKRRLPAKRAVLQGVGALLGWLLLAALFNQLTAWSESYDWRNGQIALAAALCFALALDASLSLPHQPPWRGTLHLASWGGKTSYSLYLLHTAWLLPAQSWSQRWGVLLGSAAALLGLLLSCLMLHLLLEEPARRWGRGLSQRWLTPTKAKEDFRA